MNFEEIIDINASAKVVFSLYENVARWNSWDPEVGSSSIDSTFTSGSSGKLKPKNGPETKIHFIEVIPNKSFLVSSKLPLCKISFDHEINTNKSGVKVVHRVKFEGVLSPLFGRIIGAQIKKGLPQTLQGLKNAAESVS